MLGLYMWAAQYQKGYAKEKEGRRKQKPTLESCGGEVIVRLHVPTYLFALSDERLVHDRANLPSHPSVHFNFSVTRGRFGFGFGKPQVFLKNGNKKGNYADEPVDVKMLEEEELVTRRPVFLQDHAFMSRTHALRIEL
jgi:hypothetical protein